MDPQIQLEKLIKAHHVTNLPCLSAADKKNYFNGISDQWRKIQEHPQPNHPERIKAIQTLVDVTTRVQRLMQVYKQQQGGASAGGQPVHQGQHSQALAGGQGYPSGMQVPPREEFSESVKQSARALQLAIPPQLWNASQEDRQAWTQNERKKYATYMHAHEKASKALQDLSSMITDRQQQQKPFTEDEKVKIKGRQRQYQLAMQQAKDHLTNFKNQQEQYKKQQQNISQGAGQISRPDVMSHSLTQPHVNPPPQPSDQSLSSEQVPPVNSTLDTIRNARTQAEHSPTVPAGAMAQGQINSSQPQLPSTQTSASTMPVSQADQSASNAITAGVPHSQAQNSPQSTATQLPTSQVPHPLSHKAAMAQAARSYSQPNVTQANPSSNPHGHPMPREPQSTSNKWPTSHVLQISPLTPAAMGPSRPTLSGGPSTGAMGPMGQPAIQKHPGFVLEGEGERVLSKKKLEELVRQVTGGSDGEGAEAIDPDVEETLLDVADEFVDNVITAACRLAKLRQSQTLELRDLQLILERNYNIRVPGFASDELRTVKKIQPTTAWSQKISAINAAKLTGGKGDL